MVGFKTPDRGPAKRAAAEDEGRGWEDGPAGRGKLRGKLGGNTCPARGRIAAPRVRACVRVQSCCESCAASASAWVRARAGAGTDPRLAGQGGPDDGQRDGGPDAEVALPAAELVHAQVSRARHRHGGEDDAAAVPEVLVAADPAVAVLVDDGEERVHVGRLPVLREQAPPQLGRRYHAVPVHVDQVELLRERFSVHIAFMHVTVRTSYHTPEHTAPADLVDPGFESWASPFRGGNQEWCIGWNKSHRAGSVVLR